MNLEDLPPEGAFTTKKSKQMFKTAIFSLGPHPQGAHGCVQIVENQQNLIYFGLECNHAGLKQLEAKNLSKRAKLLQKRPYSDDFLLLTSLNHHGHTPNLEN